MNKLLLFGGIGLAGFGLYRYFKNQIDLALKYEYDIKSFKIIDQNDKDVTISVDLVFTNKSNFDLLIKEYDMDIFFKDIPVAKTTSTKEFSILPNKSFTITVLGKVNLDETKQAIIPLISDILNRKPINIQVSGFVKTVFMNIPYTLNFDKNQFQYSSDLISEYGLGAKYDALKVKFPKVFSFLGVNS